MKKSVPETMLDMTNQQQQLAVATGLMGPPAPVTGTMPPPSTVPGQMQPLAVSDEQTVQHTARDRYEQFDVLSHCIIS